MSRRVVVLVFGGVQSLDVSGPVEVFASAQDAYELVTVSVDGAPVRTSSGLTLVPDTNFVDAPVADTLVVPGGWGAHDPSPDVLDWVRGQAGRARRVVSVCTGAFLLAEAGLLAGRRVTTHWGYCRALADRYPDVDVDPEPIFVRDGNIATSAGVTAGIDLALALVEEDLGREVALSIARSLVMFLRRPANQAQFSAHLSAQTAHREPLREVQRWIDENPDADLSVEMLAQQANLSPRHFARAFAFEVGVTPGKYVDRVRLEAARRMLEDTDGWIGHISRSCGFGTAESMRRAFVRALGISPAEYRRRFHSSTAERKARADRYPALRQFHGS